MGIAVKFTLNTLGAPAWSLEQTAKNARAYGYDGVDLRLIDGEVISLDSVRANHARIKELFPVAARNPPDGWQLVLLGEGDIPVEEGLRGLHATNVPPVRR